MSKLPEGLSRRRQQQNPEFGPQDLPPDRKPRSTSSVSSKSFKSLETPKSSRPGAHLKQRPTNEEQSTSDKLKTQFSKIKQSVKSVVQPILDHISPPKSDADQHRLKTSPAAITDPDEAQTEPPSPLSPELSFGSATSSIHSDHPLSPIPSSVRVDSPPASPFLVRFPDFNSSDSESDSDSSSVSQRSTPTTMADYNLMPKYDKPLNKRDLNIFFQQFSTWAVQQKLGDNAAKASLILAFQNEDARNWCLINSANAADSKITFTQYRDAFLEQAPIPSSSSVEVFSLLSQLPLANEMSSSYLLRIRAKLGDDWTSAKEKEYTSIIRQNLPKGLATYVSSQSPLPETFDALLKVTREYEKHGTDPHTPAPVIKQEASAYAVAATQPNQIEEIPSLMHVLVREVADIKSVRAQPPQQTQQQPHGHPQQFQNRRGGYRGNHNQSNFNYGRGRATSLTCHYFGIRGHLQRECRKLQRDQLQQSYRGRGRTFHNSSYPQPYFMPQRAIEWQQAPALMYQPSAIPLPQAPYVTFPPSTTSSHQSSGN